MDHAEQRTLIDHDILSASTDDESSIGIGISIRSEFLNNHDFDSESCDNSKRGESASEPVASSKEGRSFSPNTSQFSYDNEVPLITYQESLCASKRDGVKKDEEHNVLLKRIKSLEEEVRTSKGECAKKDEEGKVLLRRIKSLDKEVEGVSGLLAETLSSMKESSSKIKPFAPPTPDKNNIGGNLMTGLGRFSRRHRKILSEVRDASSETQAEREASEKQQLERIVKMHQITVLRQRKEIRIMRIGNEENRTSMDRITEELKAKEDKISALEKQFIALNEAKENGVNMNSSLPTNCLTNNRKSIIQIDAAYVSTLESNASDNSETIHDLRTKLEKEQAQSEALRGKMTEEKDLRDQITNLSIKVQARDATISAMEKSYKLHLSNLSAESKLRAKATARRKATAKRPNILSDLICEEDHLDVSQSEIADVESRDDRGEDNNELKRQIAISEATISQLKSQISTLEREKMDIAVPMNGGKKGAILSLRKVTLLQEMLDASCRHLNVVLSRLEDTNCMSSDKRFLLSVCDKSSLMQHYIKVSLRLLESRLSNELESIRLDKVQGEEETDHVIQARFDQTLKSLGESEEDVKYYLEQLKEDIDHQNIQIVAKDGIIEDLMKNEKATHIMLKTLQSEMDIVKSMGNYSSVNEEVMSKFRECTQLESEMQEKERIINRLNHVIDEYRAQEDYA